MAHTVNINVIDRSIAITNPRELPVIFEPNPQYDYAVNADELYALIQFGRIYCTDPSTGERIDGFNYYNYFPERRPGGGGGGGGVTPAEVQAMIDESTSVIDDRLDKVEADIADIEQAVDKYTKDTSIPLGRIVYVTPGQLYQATEDFISNNDPSLTLEQALAADIAAGHLAPVVDSEVGDLDERVDTLEEWKPGVDDDISYLKTAIISAEEVEYYDTLDDFPEEGSVDIIYVDKSDGKSYIWNTTTLEYELMNANNILDGSIFNSTL